MARRPFFSGNYGSALGSFDTAAKLIAQAGQTQGQAMANIGSQVGGMIEQYGLNKEKQKENKASIKSQSDMLDLLGEQDKSKKAQYLALKERLNDPDVPLTERAEYAKGLMNTLTITSQMENQKLVNDIRQQALDQNKKNQVDLDNALNILRDTREGLVSAINDGSLDRNTLTGTALLLVDNPAQLALGTRDTIDFFKSDPDKEKERQIFEGMGGVTGAIERAEDKFALDQENLKSLIRSRDIFSGKTLMNLAGIGGNPPADLEKRFSEIDTQLKKINDSKIKVKTSSLFGGEEKEITYGEFKENPDNFAPLTNDRIKALEAKEDQLIKEQTEGIFNIKIPAFDQETGESILITLGQKIEYDEARRKKREEEEQAMRQANQINVRSQLQGVRN